MDIDEEEDFGYSRLTDDESEEGSDDELDVDDVDDTGFAVL